MPKVVVNGVPMPAFHETNVRTYVKKNGVPGVYFYSLDAASLLAVVGARAFWGLPYFWASMSLRQDGARTSYASRRRLGDARCECVVEQIGDAAPARAGTLEHFLVERYWLFTARGAGEVKHAPYAIAEAKVIALSQTLTSDFGAPAHACVSPGVDVVVGS